MPQLNLATSKSKTIQPNATISGATNAAPIVVATAAPHGLESSDIVQISGVGGNGNANGLFAVTVVDSTHFSLNNSAGSGAYTSGGTCAHAGYATPGLLADNTVFVNGAGAVDWTVKLQIQSASAGSSGRFAFFDTADAAFATELPIAELAWLGGVSPSADKTLSFKKASAPATRLGNPGNYLRIKLLGLAVGATAQFSAWIEW
jgi:hypothetical protein